MTQNSPYLIGLTGGIASGKSMLSSALKGKGAIVIDTDEISRDLTAKSGAALPLIRKVFGSAMFDGESLNRRALARAVFEDPSALKTLDSLMHPLIFEEMDRQIRFNREKPALILDVPLLHETGYDKKCNEVWCSWTPEDTQIKRLIERGLTASEARARIRNQMPGIKKALLSDHVIITTGPKENNAKAVIQLYQDCLRRIKRV